VSRLRLSYNEVYLKERLSHRKIPYPVVVNHILKMYLKLK